MCVSFAKVLVPKRSEKVGGGPNLGQSKLEGSAFYAYKPIGLSVT